MSEKCQGKLDTAESLESFLLYKRSMGYVYDTQEYYMRRYVAFESESFRDNPMSKSSIQAYLDSVADKPGVFYGTVSAIREFGRYLLRTGEDAYMVPGKIASQPVPDPPYFFTSDEINAFFGAADRIRPRPEFPGREIEIPALFRIMYCCGTRSKEARLLKTSDICLGDSPHIDIMQSKGPKSRRLPISSGLAEYLHGYDRKISLLYPDREYFFPGYRGRPSHDKNFVSTSFRKVWDDAFPECSAEVRPRAYDFRHHFAWANINRWAAEGMDVNAMLPYLMRYMGHLSLKQTLYYFHFVPDFYPTFNAMTAELEDLLPEVPE